MSKNKLQEKRLKAMEKYIKKSIRHSHKNITEYSYEYGVIDGKYLFDAFDIVISNDDLSNFGLNKDNVDNLKWKDDPIEVFINIKD